MEYYGIILFSLNNDLAGKIIAGLRLRTVSAKAHNEYTRLTQKNKFIVIVNKS